MPSRKARLESLVEAGRRSALAGSRRVLVSLSETIDPVDPLSALESFARGSGVSEQARRLLSAGQMYWERPADAFAMAGVGAVATFDHSGESRFAETDDEWMDLLDGAIIQNDSPSVAGTGPVLMGGFSFEPEGPRTTTWRGFKSSRMMIPAVLVTATGGETRITLNSVISATGEAVIEPDLLASLADAIANPGSESDSFQDSSDSETEVNVSEMSARSDWQSMVDAALADISAGDLKKVVIARAVRLCTPGPIDVFAVLRHLRSLYPQSFVFSLWESGHAFVGASPERLVRLTDREVEASSLAGTIERGATPAEDAANAKQLRESAKDLAEHSAVRNELFSVLSETCDDVRAADQPSLLTLPHVHHLHTSLRARLRENGSLLSLVGRLHPTPAVGGSPREPALRFIREKESLDRGWYAAPVGWIGGKGGEFAVALRSAVIDGDSAVLFAGCGIVADSDPDLEYAESNLKLQAMQLAISASLATVPADLQMITAAEPLS